MRHRILIIEDNSDNTKLLTWVMDDAGYECHCVGSAEDGIATLERESFDLVLMDVGLPGMNGKEATQHLRADPRFATLPIIAVTAHAVTTEIQAIKDSGVTALITKPLDEPKLLDTMQLLLRGDLIND